MAKQTKKAASKTAKSPGTAKQPQFEAMLFAEGENLHPITIRAIFKKGAGGVFFFGENIPQNQKITTDGGPDSFTISQAAGNQMVTVSGSAPAGGSVSIEVKEGTTVLSPASNNVFTQPTFSGFIFYTIS